MGILAIPFHIHKHSLGYHALPVTTCFFIVLFTRQESQPGFFFALENRRIIHFNQSICPYFKYILLPKSMDDHCVSKFEFAQTDKRTGQPIGQIDVTGEYAIPVPGWGY